MKALITGFEPFSRWQRNPSGETARHLDGATIVDLEVSGLVLPVSFARASAPLIEAIDTLRPDFVLNLGLGGVGVRVERVAVNCARAPEGGDNDGYDPQCCRVVEDGPDMYEATLPVGEIVELLTNLNFDVAPSDSAGEYLCNYAMYTTLYHIATHGYPTRAGFIHASPLSDEASASNDGKGMSLKEWIGFTEAVLYLLRSEMLLHR